MTITYDYVANALELTQASVKRLFSEENISLQRLDQMCQWVDMEISDLTAMVNAQQEQLQHLTIEQEKELTNDLTLLLIAVCVLNKWTTPQIIQYYELTERECVQKLAKLDRLKIIDLLPGNRIKLLVAANFGWRENGPIQQFFQHRKGQESFNTRFKQDDECLIVMNGMLCAHSNGEFQRKLKRLAREFEILNYEDTALPFEKRNGVTLVMALRHWRYGLFQPLLRS